jgi:Spy/CpxP family protein refolding chaperone
MATLITATRIVAPVLAIGLAATALFTGCRHRGGYGFRGHWGHDPACVEEHVNKRVDKMLDEIDATEAQREQVHDIKDGLLPKMLALAGDRAKFHQELDALWSAETPNPSNLRSLVDEKTEALRTAGYDLIDATIELHGVLTPEQRSQVAEMAEKRRRCRR